MRGQPEMAKNQLNCVCVFSVDKQNKTNQTDQNALSLKFGTNEKKRPTALVQR